MRAQLATAVGGYDFLKPPSLENAAATKGLKQRFFRSIHLDKSPSRELLEAVATCLVLWKHEHTR